MCISGTIYDQVTGKLSLAITFAGEQQVKNIASAVRAYHINPDSSSDEGGLDDPAVFAMPTGPAIAVLPFVNMSSDPEQDYFSDGLTEDIITELAHCRDVYVLARNTTFQYKGRPVDVAALGAQLKVQYVLEGSVRKSGNRVRITAQLIETAGASHVWAERYDREVEDIFAIQEDIASRIVGMIAGGDMSVLMQVRRDRASRKPLSAMQAYDYVLRAHVESYNRTTYASAKSLLEKAIGLAPDYARARHEYAWLKLQGWAYRLEEHPEPPQLMKQDAIKAVELDPSDARAHRTAAFGYFLDRQFDRFEQEAGRALALAPNDAAILAQLSTLYFLRDPDGRGVDLARKGSS